MIHQGVIARGKSIHDILAVTIKQELKQEYNLNLGEMYGIIDYISELEIENAKLEAECEISRQRLGPAGYKLLQELLDLRSKLALATKALEWYEAEELWIAELVGPERARVALREISNA